MWQRFTERARKVVFYAQEEAQRFGEGYVSPEHLLLGLVRDSDSVAAVVLDTLGISRNRVRAEIESCLSNLGERSSQNMTLTPSAKRVIDFAYDERLKLDNDYIGTEHLLLGLIREMDSPAGKVLSKLGVELEKARQSVVELQDRESKSRAERTSTAEASSDLPQNLDSLLLVIRQNVSVPSLIFLTAVSDKDAVARKVLTDLGVDVESLLCYVEAQMINRSQPPSSISFDQVLNVASALSSERGIPMDSGDLLVAVLQLEPEHGPMAHLGNISVEQVKEGLALIDAS